LSIRFQYTANREDVEKVPWPLRFLQENGPIKRVTKDFFNTLEPRDLTNEDKRGIIDDASLLAMNAFLLRTQLCNCVEWSRIEVSNAAAKLFPDDKRRPNQRRAA